MPVIVGHGTLASIPEEHITDKISRKVMSGQQGMMVWWHFEAGGHAAAHKHPHEQISWMIKGRMDLRQRQVPEFPRDLFWHQAHVVPLRDAANRDARSGNARPPAANGAIVFLATNGTIGRIRKLSRIAPSRYSSAGRCSASGGPPPVARRSSSIRRSSTS